MGDEHGTPTEDMCCMCTMEDITIEDGNYVEYQSYPSMKWKPALFEKCIVEKLLDEQFHQYMDRVQKSDCEAELRRLMEIGPPVYIKDNHGFPLDEGDTHIVKLWFAADNDERSSKLTGAVEGAEREELWETLKSFSVTDKKDEENNSN